MSKKGKLLITGCAGYVGSAFLREAIKEGYDIRCVDRLIYGGDHLAGFLKFWSIIFTWSVKLNAVTAVVTVRDSGNLVKRLI